MTARPVPLPRQDIACSEPGFNASPGRHSCPEAGMTAIPARAAALPTDETGRPALSSFRPHCGNFPSHAPVATHIAKFGGAFWGQFFVARQGAGILFHLFNGLHPALTPKAQCTRSCGICGDLWKTRAHPDHRRAAFGPMQGPRILERHDKILRSGTFAEDP